MNLDALVSALKMDESFRALVYDDATGESIGPGSVVVGYPTIGYGWNCAANKMTSGQAEDRLRYDAINSLRDAADLIPNWLYIDDVRQNVVANLVFNVGKSRAAGFVKFLAAVKAEDWKTATAELVNSKWYGQVGHRGVRLANEMLTGVVQT